MITLSDTSGFDHYSVVRHEDGTVSVFINYNTDITNKEIVVQLDPKKSGKSALSKIDTSTRAFLVVPNDNENANYYEEAEYDMARNVELLSTIISSSSLLLFFICLFAGKLVGVELMSVVQISYAALVVL